MMVEHLKDKQASEAVADVMRRAPAQRLERETREALAIGRERAAAAIGENPGRVPGARKPRREQRHRRARHP